MTAPAIRVRFLARLLSLLATVMLVAAPLAPPAMAMPMDCCPDAPCHDHQTPRHPSKATCPQVCAVGCVVVPAPAEAATRPATFDNAPLQPATAPRLIGRAITPEPPPPR